MKYWYDGHLGDVYSSDEILTDKELYCGICHDTDFLIGKFETEQEALKALEED